MVNKLKECNYCGREMPSNLMPGHLRACERIHGYYKSINDMWLDIGERGLSAVAHTLKIAPSSLATAVSKAYPKRYRKYVNDRNAKLSCIKCQNEMVAHKLKQHRQGWCSHTSPPEQLAAEMIEYGLESYPDHDLSHVRQRVYKQIRKIRNGNELVKSIRAEYMARHKRRNKAPDNCCPRCEIIITDDLNSGVHGEHVATKHTRKITRRGVLCKFCVDGPQPQPEKWQWAGDNYYRLSI